MGLSVRRCFHFRLATDVVMIGGVELEGILFKLSLINAHVVCKLLLSLGISQM